MADRDLFARIADLGVDLYKMANREASKPTPPQLRGQRIGDDYYVRADDLAALLDAKGVLPNLAASLRKKTQ